MDPTLALELLALRATELEINMDRQIDPEEYTTSLPIQKVTIYRGVFSRDGTTVVKSVLFGPPMDERTIRRVVREVKIWSTLRHNNILPPLGITTKFNSTISIVNHCNIGTENAYDYVQNERNDPRPLLDGIARGLEYIHMYTPGPVVHGNLRGLSVMIAHDGRPILTDFGLFYLDISSFSLHVDPQRGDIFNWMAPENLGLQGFSGTCQGDVWSFGMTMLELFTRNAPFHDIKSQEHVKDRILQGPPERPDYGSTYSRMTDEWWQLCAWCCQHDPTMRPTMTRIVSNIEEIMAMTDSSYALNILSHHAAIQGINVDQGFEARQSIGTDSFLNATMYRATLNPGGISVVIKTLLPETPNDNRMIKRVIRNVKLWTTLRHDNVLPPFGLTTKFRPAIYLVTKWMVKGNAHDYVQNTAHDPRPLIIGIARGLHFLHHHEQGPIVHGDLRGLNIAISDGGRALLTDIGVARLAESSGIHIDTPHRAALSWAAPEYVTTSSFVGTPAGDVWAFGMTILELFTRQKPFHEVRNSIGVMIRIIQNRLPSRPIDAATCSRMTDEWWEICSLCWQRDPSARPVISDIATKTEKMNKRNLKLLLRQQRIRLSDVWHRVKNFKF